MATIGDAKDKFVKVNGLRLHYLDWGGRSPNVLLLVHGLAGNAHRWDSFAPEVRGDYRVLAMDLRGHGDSDHCRDGYPATGFASDVHGFAQALGLVRFDLIGHSLGARTAMAYAGDHAQDLKHLVLVDFGPEASRQGARGVMARTGNRPLGFRSEAEAIQWYQEDDPGRSQEAYQQMVKYGLRANWTGRLVWKHDSELFWITGSASLKEVPYMWEQVRKISCPTLVMKGETSDLLDREIVDKMMTAMPRARFVEVKGAGHRIPADQPGEFKRLVSEFLAG